LGDQRRDGENNSKSGDGTGQMAQTWMFMMMMMMKYEKLQRAGDVPWMDKYPIYTDLVGNLF